MSFASFPLDKLGLTQQQLAACEKAGYSIASDILLANPHELNKRLRLPRPSDVQELVAKVAKAIAPSTSRVTTWLDIPSPTDQGAGPKTPGKGRRRSGSRRNSFAVRSGLDGWIGSGDAGLDTLMGGGLKVGCITELTGESASGKSHFCLAYALACQLSTLCGSPGSPVILTTEKSIPTKRLSELAEAMIRQHGSQDFLTVKMMMDAIVTTKLQDIEQLDDMLNYRLPALLDSRRGKQRTTSLMGKVFPPDADAHANGVAPGKTTGASGSAKPFRLLILDSITALLRGSDTAFTTTSGGLAQRSKHLCSIADRLKALALEYELAILVINQVSDVFHRPSSIAPPKPPSRPTSPALAGSQAPPLSSQWTPSQHPGHSQAFYTDGDDPPMRYSTQARWFSGQSETLGKEASLGIVWANAINVRVMLSRTGRRKRLDPDELSVRKRLRPSDPYAREEADAAAAEVDPSLIRRAHLIFSPFAASATVDYVITETGIHAVADSYKLDDSMDALRKKADARKRRRQAAEDDGVDDWKEEVRVEDGEVYDDIGHLPSDFWDEELDEEAPIQGTVDA